MKILRKLLFKTLGFKKYLGLVSGTYLLMVRNNFLKGKYPELFFLKDIIKPGFHCIDIGANLGYYSYFLSKYSGSKGKVYAVEPIPVFGEVWQMNMKSSKFNNYELLPYALGENEQKVVMSTPIKDGVVRHGLTNVSEGDNGEEAIDFEVEMKVPEKIFGNLQKLDFIKCDIEGYEHKVFPLMENIINKFRPYVQTELSGEYNKQQVVNLFNKIAYSAFALKESKLSKVSGNEIHTVQSDFYFIPNERIEEINALVN